MHKNCEMLPDIKNMNAWLQEIAKQLRLSLSAGKSRVRRGREKLKAVFLECCHLELDWQGSLLSAEVKPDCPTFYVRREISSVLGLISRNEPQNGF
ncbi:hypothetical protein [Rufibacter sp. LB8]|uniref:hypothetical protein n=1 Tax=Rufibacter sp. LB8 TaxID=2777781 RepID=UPI00178C503E|nr:hypothetical protein [Rufibacter sp. LB8]